MPFVKQERDQAQQAQGACQSAQCGRQAQAQGCRNSVRCSRPVQPPEAMVQQHGQCRQPGQIDKQKDSQHGNERVERPGIQHQYVEQHKSAESQSAKRKAVPCVQGKSQNGGQRNRPGKQRRSRDSRAVRARRNKIHQSQAAQPGCGPDQHVRGRASQAFRLGAATQQTAATPPSRSSRRARRRTTNLRVQCCRLRRTAAQQAGSTARRCAAARTAAQRRPPRQGRNRAPWRRSGKSGQTPPRTAPCKAPHPAWPARPQPRPAPPVSDGTTSAGTGTGIAGSGIAGSGYAGSGMTGVRRTGAGHGVWAGIRFCCTLFPPA